MSDTKLIVDTIVAFQEENEKLKDKLEKIEQIVNDWKNGDIEGQDTILALHKIKEVLENE